MTAPSAIVFDETQPSGRLGGWGYKITRKHGHAQNIHGEQFVTITLHNGKKRTIGTQRPDELLSAIRVLAQLPPDESEIEKVESAGGTTRGAAAQ